MLRSQLFSQVMVAVLALAAGCGGGATTPDAGSQDAAPSCATDQTLCGGRCVDLARDAQHCGDCTTSCAVGEVCTASVCEAQCPAGQSVCDGACFDLDSSRMHCGDCATSCAAGEVCSGGACALSCGGSTPTQCGDACVDMDTDRAHCGDCTTACASGEVCSGGACALSCGGSTPTQCGDACVDTATNPNHCGGCGTPCAVTTPTCSGGVCSSGTVVSCGGYDYPETTIVPSTSCTGWYSGCSGSREFRVVGCYSTNPSNVCPVGFGPASLMLIGQWAAAASITRYDSGTSVCAWTDGGAAGSMCGGSGPHMNYCWPKGEACLASCPTNCCPATGPCASSSASPLLCVSDA